MSSSVVSKLKFFNHLFQINIGNSISLEPRLFFDEIPQDGMFTVDSLGDYVPVQNPSLIVNDPYFENESGDITIKTLI